MKPAMIVERYIVLHRMMKLMVGIEPAAVIHCESYDLI